MYLTHNTTLLFYRFSGELCIPTFCSIKVTYISSLDVAKISSQGLQRLCHPREPGWQSQGTGMARSLPSQRFWDTIEILRITEGENIAENDTKSIKSSQPVLLFLFAQSKTSYVVLIHSPIYLSFTKPHCCSLITMGSLIRNAIDPLIFIRLYGVSVSVTGLIL